MTWDLGAGLEGHGVVVTGAAGGIGTSVARAFAAAGARVVAVDRERAALETLVHGLDGAGHVALTADLADLGTHNKLFDLALEAVGRVDVLANLAAVLRRRRTLEEVTEADWDLQHDVNLKACFFLCRAAASMMKERRTAGRIITFASQGWWTGGFGGSVVYAATKGGVVSMTRGLARSYGPHGITVNAVAPGQVHTPMLTEGLDPDLYEEMKRQTPLGYVAEPDDLAGVVVFLASQHARYITGATINVSGGFLMY